MPKITIDDREYDVDALSAEARQQLDMFVACEARLRDLQRDAAITQTARNTYAAQLRSFLPTPLESALAQGETLKFS